MELSIKKKPKATLKVRVYRAKTGKWEDINPSKIKVATGYIKQLIKK